MVQPGPSLSYRLPAGRRVMGVDDRMLRRVLDRSDDPSVPLPPVLAPTACDVLRRGRARGHRPEVARTAVRLGDVRVRTLELRLIGFVLATCWTVAAAYVLIGYRPGGPIDIAVGIA